MLGKIVGLSPYTYFRQKWNVFDAVVVLFSLLEYFVETTGGFSILRAFRLVSLELDEKVRQFSTQLFVDADREAGQTLADPQQTSADHRAYAKQALASHSRLPSSSLYICSGWDAAPP